MSSTSRIVAVIAMASLAGCNSIKSNDRSKDFVASGSRAATLLTNPTHCRHGKAPDHRWPIFTITTADLKSGKDHNWHILHDFAMRPANPELVIDPKDRFIIIDGAKSDELSLVHTREISGKYKEIARATITIKGAMLWASGRAVLKTSGKEIGDYFVFRIPDNLNNRTKKCEHPNNYGAISCPSLHVEYFEDTDIKNLPFKPVLGTNVKPTSSAASCIISFETGDGDGDNGPDR